MTILLAHVPNASADAAFDAAVDQAAARAVPLTILNVSRGDALVEKDSATTEDLASMQARATGRGVDTSVRTEVAADPVDAILTAASAPGTGILVIGIRHRSPVGKLFLGSDAQRILLDAECPVLAVKPVRA